MTKTHRLKIEQPYLDEILAGRKKSEIRFNDRDYQRGDLLELFVLGSSDKYCFEITHIHSGLGMQEGYVVLSINS